MTSLSDLEAQVAPREALLDRLRALLVERLHLSREVDELDPDAPLFGSGFGLDSLDAVELVVCLESELGVRVNDAVALRQVFRSLNTMTDLVLAERGGRP
ncbi:MAG TPA: phosphopantetheine-binding protein [Kofleriaceae bacterium]|nr:phosphopantetheine-binding protein [Kofleriaceae bacterium]